jgi:atypical dual specificity phosphatase
MFSTTPSPAYSEMATSTLTCSSLPPTHYCTDVLLPQQQQQHTSINSILKRPIPNSYWATPLLLACEYPWCPGVAKQKIEALLAAGVRTFIDLTEVNELLAYGSYLAARAEAMGLTDIEYHRFPIVDRSLPESVEYMRNILKVLKDNEQRGRITAVHCRGGIGRTGKSALLSQTEDQFIITQLVV